MLPNNNYIVRKLGTNKTQILHRILLRKYTPVAPPPDIIVAEREFERDTDIEVSQDDLYAITWESNFGDNPFDNNDSTSKKEKRAQKGTDPNGTPQNEAPLGSTPQGDPNAQNANTDDAMDTTSIENNVGSSPTLTSRPIEETLDDSSNQNAPGGSPDHEMTELENDANQHSENKDAEVPSNTRGTREV